MSKIEKFEDIQAWQRARELTKQIYKITKGTLFFKDFELKAQIRRSGVSIMANIAEGFARRTHKEFVNFLGMAHASVAEVQSHLYIALDQNYISEKKFTELYYSADEVSRMIQGLVKYLRNPKTPKLSNSITL